MSGQDTVGALAFPLLSLTVAACAGRVYLFPHTHIQPNIGFEAEAVLVSRDAPERTVVCFVVKDSKPPCGG